ncbi:MAG: RHS repeat-associated core domain-containing protein, partial [Planctomycetota bacterium]|nr:RHS repeat-associated core domain-containing protein [Planctomycetota bacterium]
SDDTNVTVQTSYTADGQISTITAVNSNTGNQITQYVYGTTLSDSAIATSNLKCSEVYPDSVDSDDCIKFTYNRQGQVTTKTDQNGTVHSYDYDKLARGTENRVTTLASGVDGAVLRIETTFEVRGMVEHITSYDNATVGSGAIVNDVLVAYNSFGQVTADYQSHSGAVNMASTPKVQYAYLSGSANSIRPTLMAYPNGRVLTYSFGTVGGANDALSRIYALVDNDGTTQLAAYQYLGVGAFVEVDYTEPDIKYTLIDLSSANDPDTGDIYSGLDRFSRVKDCRWYNYGTSADTARIKHGYDRAGNRLYREDPVAASYGKAFDELYAYDRTYRLIDMQRGTLNGSKTAISDGTKTFEQCWTLDATGNWQGFREDSDGNSSWDLVQARSDNKVNEITAVTNSVGSAWTAPEYNRNGNMTTVPQPADPTKGYSATYDAWNRLVKLVDASNSQTAQENAYDGRTFRVVRKTYTAGVFSETRQLLYSTGWQVVEERVGAATAAERQFVWGLRYLDDLVVRDRDTTGGATLNERLYPLQDANWNVVALASSGGTIQERYAYSAYGVPTVLTGAFAARGTSSYVWETLYCGYHWDAVSALYLIRNRSYSIAVSGWIQRDPLGKVAGVNLYAYVTNRPLIYIDPLGLQSTSSTTKLKKKQKKTPTPIDISTYVVESGGEEGFFNALAGNLVEAPVQVNTGDELLGALVDSCETEECIRTWIHTQHAWRPNSDFGKLVGGGFGGGSTSGGCGFYGKDKAEGINRKKGGRGLPDLAKAIDKKTIKFCSPCRIYVYGCEVATTGDFADELQKVTGCTVYAGAGKVSTTHSDGKAGTHSDPWRAEGGWYVFGPNNGEKKMLKGKYISPVVLE